MEELVGAASGDEEEIEEIPVVLKTSHGAMKGNTFCAPKLVKDSK